MLWTRIIAELNSGFGRCSGSSDSRQEITISGIELAEKIRKQQFKTGNLPGRPATAPDIWAAILAALLYQEFFLDTPSRALAKFAQNLSRFSD